MAIEATTDGEKMIQLDGKIDNLNDKIDNVCESLDRVVLALERLETTRVSDHELRLNKIEKWQSEWMGVSRFIAIAAAVISIISILYTMAKK